jgi:hypothetical protein
MRFIFLLATSIIINFTTTPDTLMTGVRVQRNGAVVANLPATASSYTDTNVQGGVPYAYSVIATGSDPTVGNSDPSNTLGFTLPVPVPTFIPNDTFQVVTSGSNLNVRSSPGGPIVGSIKNGSTGLIVSGPTVSGGVSYWRINKVNNGYVVETFIRQ